MAYTARAVGIGLGYAADVAFGDPRRGHPVAGFGRAARALERRWWADSKARGTAYAGVLVGSVATAGLLAERTARRHRHPVVAAALEAALVAAATWTTLGGRSLVAEGEAMSGLLRRQDLPGARTRLSHLCSRDATDLDPVDLARATVESLAENTSDAVVAPLFWGVVAGAPGLLGYRAANTLDAMVGYRNRRYARFGWAAARLDDVLNLLPARATAVLTAAAAPSVGGDPARARLVWRRDAHHHPSPNAGPVEASFAGALGVRLGGHNTYGGTVEDRSVLDGGRAVRVDDVARAARLSRVVGAAALACGLLALLGSRLGGARG